MADGIILPYEENDRAKPAIHVVLIEVDYKKQYDRKTGAELVGEDKEIHVVEWVRKGTNGATNRMEVNRLKENEPAVWAVVRPVYEAWLKGQEEPTEGTPLSAWAGANKRQVQKLRDIHIRTVEDVAGMNDAAMDVFGMGARALRDNARRFLASKPTAQMAAELAARDATITSMQQQLAELTALVQTATEPDKRKAKAA